MEHPDSEYWDESMTDLLGALQSEIEDDSLVDDFRKEMWPQLEEWALEAGLRIRILMKSAPAEPRPILARLNLGLVERLLYQLDLQSAPIKDG